MAAICGDCPCVVVPSKQILKEAGMDDCSIGYCLYGRDFVRLDDDPCIWGCEEEED